MARELAGGGQKGQVPVQGLVGPVRQLVGRRQLDTVLGQGQEPGGEQVLDPATEIGIAGYRLSQPVEFLLDAAPQVTVDGAQLGVELAPSIGFGQGFHELHQHLMYRTQRA